MFGSPSPLVVLGARSWARPRQAGGEPPARLGGRVPVVKPYSCPGGCGRCGPRSRCGASPGRADRPSPCCPRALPRRGVRRFVTNDVRRSVWRAVGELLARGSADAVDRSAGLSARNTAVRRHRGGSRYAPELSGAMRRLSASEQPVEWNRACEAAWCPQTRTARSGAGRRGCPAIGLERSGSARGAKRPSAGRPARGVWNGPCRMTRVGCFGGRVPRGRAM
jgi:hypothetical protein